MTGGKEDSTGGGELEQGGIGHNLPNLQGTLKKKASGATKLAFVRKSKGPLKQAITPGPANC